VQLHFLVEEKTMLFSRSPIRRFALFLSFAAVLTPLSRATLKDAPAQAPQTPLVLTAQQQQDQIRDLAAHILQHADKAGCKKSSCTILVANFTIPSGFTSTLGIQLADAISKELAIQQNTIRIIDRSRLQSFFEEERIPNSLFNDEKAICWLGKQLGASTVLRGTTEDREGPLRVQASLLSCTKDKTGPVEEFSFSDPDSKAHLRPIEPFPETLPNPDSASVPLIRFAGKDGVTVPRCSYCPSANYTDPARLAKLNGIVVLQLTISEQGRTVDARVVRGLPYGLNESAIRSVRDWQFQPAMRNGQPVTCMVMTETSFHLY
jgi:TonB family protein